MSGHMKGGHGLRSVPSSAFKGSPGGGDTAPVGYGMSETVLDNGVRVLSEEIPGVRSAAVGVWVRHGAAHDAPDHAGASHLLEHMVFKGTPSRSPRDIALSLEGLGGSLDAYTSREHTGYQARVLDQHLGDALDVLADITLHPLLRDRDLELEREVVLEEIAEVEDTPDDLVFEVHGERLWEGHAYGRSILGTKESVAVLPGDAIRSLHAEAYCGRNLVVAAAGHVAHGSFVERVAALFGAVPPGEPARALPPLPQAPSGDERVARDTAQSHVVFGTTLPGHSDPVRYGLALLSLALGGGMSSRLFQRVREELGLCYSVYTYQSFYAAGGVGGVYVGTRPSTEERAVEAIRGELARVAREGLADDELEQAKQQLKGQIMLSLESTGSRLYRLTGSALYDEPWVGLDDLLGLIDAVTVEGVAGLARRYMNPDAQLVMRLGPV